MKKTITKELKKAGARPDAEIDTSDIPEVTDLAGCGARVENVPPAIIWIEPAACVECGHRGGKIAVSGWPHPAPELPGVPLVCGGCKAVMTREAGAPRGFTEGELGKLQTDSDAIYI